MQDNRCCGGCNIFGGNNCCWIFIVLILTAKNDDNAIIGMLEITNYSHISLFFVDDKYFKSGIATQLFEESKNILQSDKYTVKSSSYALEFYKKLGFVQLYNDIQVENGVHFYYMLY